MRQRTGQRRTGTGAWGHAGGPGGHVQLQRAAAGGVGAVLTLALAAGGIGAFGDQSALAATTTAMSRPDTGSTGGSTGGSAAGLADRIVPVAPLSKPHSADVLIRVPDGATARQAARIGALHGVDAVEPVDYATTTIAGHQATLLGVDPSTFRMFTPKPTAGSDPLWSNVASGDLAVSFDMGKETRLPLGRPVDVRPASAGFPARLRVGAMATMLPGVDAVVSNGTARALGIPRDNALLLSAPKADTAKLAKALRKAFPDDATVRFLRSRQPVRTTHPGRATPTPTPSQSAPADANGHLSPQRIAIAIRAAYGKLGRPYVWGAEGPDSFDCSGLVQWAFAKAGVSMPRVTDQQFLTGRHLPYSQARAGDLLFWRNDPTAPDYVSHVAIYLGHGKMIVAPHTGDVVKIQKVYLNNFAGAVRIQVR